MTDEYVLEAQAGQSFEPRLPAAGQGLPDFNDYPQTYYDRFMAAAPDGILICDRNLHILDCNQRAADQFGHSRTQLHGLSLEHLIPGAGGSFTHFTGAFHLEAPLNGQRYDGTEFPVEVHGYVDGDQVQGSYVIFTHDITARVKAQNRQHQIQEQIDETRRLEAIGSLSAGIAHEINTPIQFIGDNLGYLSDSLARVFASYRTYYGLHHPQASGSDQHGAALVKTDLDGDIQEISDALRESLEGIKQVRDIVLLMKQFAHPGSGAMAPANLNEIVHNVASICKNRWKHIGRIDLELADHLPKIYCRVGQIQQVILNLILNAIDAIEEDNLENKKILVETNYDTDFVVISISDTGLGIPDHIKNRIFDPFFTTKPVGKGTGQGLALAKDVIMKGHGGRLQLVEKPGYATTFQILLLRSEIVVSNQEDN